MAIQPQIIAETVLCSPCKTGGAWYTASKPCYLFFTRDDKRENPPEDVMHRIVLFLCVVMVLSGTSLAGSGLEPDPDALWNYMQESDYTSWGYFPGHEGMQHGDAPHGKYHKVFVNEAGLSSRAAPVRYGTVIVKENYTGSKKLAAITIMAKIRGTNPDGGDWYWVKYTPRGKAEKAGAPAGCVRCHGAVQRNDYVFLYNYR